MDVLVSFCNLPVPMATGLLRLREEQATSGWVPLLDSRCAIRSVTGIGQTSSRVYVVWLDVEKGCFVTVLEKPSLEVIGVHRLIGVHDAHSLCVDEGSLCVVSTGTDELWRFPLTGDTVQSGEAIWRASDEQRDTHHVNAVAHAWGRLCCCAFGPKSSALWSSAVEGYIVDVASGEVLTSALEHPHSLYSVGKDVYVAESRRARVHCLTRGVAYEAGGYARGIATLADGTLVVATSTARLKSKSTGIIENPADPGESFGRAGLSFLTSGDGQQGNLPQHWGDLSCFGPEIYDVVTLQPLPAAARGDWP